jgi:hypothetical protein
MGHGRNYGSAKRATIARGESLGQSFLVPMVDPHAPNLASSRRISERVTSLAEGGWSDNCTTYQIPHIPVFSQYLSPACCDLR